MRFALRAGGLAIVTALSAIVILFRPGVQPVAAAAAQPALDADLALVPADALGFVHVRAAELWKNDLFAGFRQTFEKAGPKALAALDSKFVPKISTFERATAFAMLDERSREPLVFAVLRFSADFNPDDVANAYLPEAEKKLVNGKAVYSSSRGHFELHFPDRRHIVVGPPDKSLEVYLKHVHPRSGPLTNGLKLAASGKPVVAAVNVAALPIPPKALSELPTEARALLKAEHVAISLDLATAARVELVAGYKNEVEAQDAEKAITALAEYGRKELAKIKDDIEKKLYDPKAKVPEPIDRLPDAVLSVFALGAINQVDELLANPGAFVKRNGTELTAGVTLPKELIAGATSVAAIGTALLLPAVQKVRMAAARMQSQNNLKQIGIALHAYHDAFGRMPQDILDKNGKPILSWRVAILPFLEQDNVYKQFRMDEPWDSEHNKKWSQLAIKVYMSPNADPITPPGMTQYRAFVGPGAAFERGMPLKIPGSFPDGTSNTIAVVEAGDPVPWAKPDDIPFDPKKPVPKLALPGVTDLVNVLMLDGSVRTINTRTITEKTLRNAIMRNDGEPLGNDFDK
jgi:hypothetical protein